MRPVVVDQEGLRIVVDVARGHKNPHLCRESWGWFMCPLLLQSLGAGLAMERLGACL